ncbi:MAG: glycosyltransferase family 39 protein, partial [Anaerolinea sp.]|nr:glycosyltransferase family 39 protein [Anaerolinea sp.]
MLLLLLFIGLRLYDLLHFPIFLDEMSHIDWADDIYARQPFTGAANGKLFGLWWMALFALTGDPAIFLARAATALFALIGAALLYRTAALLAGRRAGLLALLLYAVQPYGLFYDRLALTDAYVTPFALPAPGGWRAQLRGPIISAATALITGGAIWTLLRWRGYDYFNTPTAVVGTSAIDTLWARLPVNFGALWAIDSAYLTQPFLIVAAVLALAAIILRPRAGLFALLALFVPLTGLLAFAVKMSARYFQFHTAFLILLAAVGAQALIARWPRLRPVMIGLALLWIATFALPFFVRYLAAPETLALPPLDRVEYITGDSAGFGLREIAA